MHLSGFVMEIRHLRDNGITILTFRGHVTTSVTWPFDLQWSTSYGWSIATMRLSGTVMEIWRLKSKTCTQTHTHRHGMTDTHKDEQNDQSHNLLQCSLRSHFAEIINLPTLCDTVGNGTKHDSTDLRCHRPCHCAQDHWKQRRHFGWETPSQRPECRRLAARPYYTPSVLVLYIFTCTCTLYKDRTRTMPTTDAFWRCFHYLHATACA